MMKIKIRKANNKDITGLIKLNRELQSYHRKLDKIYAPVSQIRDSYKDYLSKNITKRTMRIIVVEANNRLVGYIGGNIKKTNPYWAPKKMGEISDGFIEAKYRKSGIGEKIVKEIFSWFKKNEVRYIMLSVDSKNIIGLSAWQKYGFKEFRKRMVKYL